MREHGEMVASVSRFVRSAFVVFCLSLSLFEEEEEEEQDEGRRKNTIVVRFSPSLSHSKRYLSPGCGTQPIQHDDDEDDEEMKRDQKR